MPPNSGAPRDWDVSHNPSWTNRSFSPGVSLYAYVGSNPLSFVDPLGFQAESERDLLEPIDVAGPINAANYRQVFARIRQYDQDFEDPIASSGEVQYTRADVARLEEVLRGKVMEGCRAPTPVGRRGFPMSVQPGTNTAANIGGRTFTGHALDRMQEHGLVPSVVENTIQTGQSSPGNMPGTSVYTDPVNGTKAVIDTASGRVITTY